MKVNPSTMFVSLVSLLVLRLSPLLLAADSSWSCTVTCVWSTDNGMDNTTCEGDGSRQTIICPTSTDSASVTEEVTRYLGNLPRNVSSKMRSLKIIAPLSTIPDNCINRLSNLVTFESSWGALTELQDGLFDGLRYLQKVTFIRNKITQIGTHLFAEESGLSSLTHVELDDNKLVTLDAWVFYRARIGLTNDKFVTISFRDNVIERFTNKIGWKYSCRELKQYYAQILLMGNNVQHVNDIIGGWGLNWKDCNTTSVSSILIFVSSESLLCDCIDYDFRLAFYKNLNGWIFRGLRYCFIRDSVCVLTDDCPAACKCTYDALEKAIKVNCSSVGLTTMPSKLPPLKPYSQYVIDISYNSHLTKLSGSGEYFANTRSFNVSKSGVVSFDDTAARELFQVIDAIILSGNRLKSLPNVASSLKPLANFTRIDMSNNPWECSCSNSWMIGWLNSIKDNLVNVEQILCDSPPSFNNKQLMRLTVEDVCDNPASKATVVAIAVSLSVVAAVVIVVIVSLLIAWRIRFKLFVTLHIHPFDRDECDGEDMKYDVFFSCCDEDQDDYGNFILKRIEKEGYKVCFPDRDFHAGRTNHDNMLEAIKQSKRTICLITENFLRDILRVHEFNQAFDYYLLELGKRRLIALVKLDDPTLSNINTPDTVTVREFLRRYTYIAYSHQPDDTSWLQRLLYALPVKGMQQQQLLQQNENRDNELHGRL